MDFGDAEYCTSHADAKVFHSSFNEIRASCHPRCGPFLIGLTSKPFDRRKKQPRPAFKLPNNRSSKEDSLGNSSSFLPYNPSAMPSSSASSSTPPLPSKEEVKEEVVAATKSTLSGLRSLAAGGVGGVCAVVVGHPFDLVKVRLQTADKGVYTGAIDVVRKTVAREGLARV